MVQVAFGIHPLFATTHLAIRGKTLGWDIFLEIPINMAKSASQAGREESLQNWMRPRFWLIYFATCVKLRDTCFNSKRIYSLGMVAPLYTQSGGEAVTSNEIRFFKMYKTCARSLAHENFVGCHLRRFELEGILIKNKGIPSVQNL